MRDASHATRHPTVPAPTTATRWPGRMVASHTPFSAVSMFAASTARRAGTSSGTTCTASAGTTKRVWCGYREKTMRPISAGGPCSTRPTLA